MPSRRTRPSHAVRYVLLVVFGNALTFIPDGWAAESSTTATPRTEPTNFFVATTGRDNWSGRLPETNATGTDGPFATLKRARDAIRQLKNRSGGRLPSPVTVLVRGGRYYQNEPLFLSPDDSGTQDCPVRYMAYADEKPILSGGRRITGWRPYKDKILQCDLPEAKGGKWKPRQLFVDSQPQTRARFPNADPNTPWHHGWLTVEGPAEKDSFVAFKHVPNAFPRRWARPTQGEVFMMMAWGYSVLSPIKKVDPAQHTVTMVKGVKNFARPPWGDGFATHFGYGLDYVGHGRAFRFFVENLLEELDQPGEWCVDTDEGKLYFWPPAGSLDGRTVVAPSLDCLIRLHNTFHITFEGFTFTETLNAGNNMHRFGYEGTGAMFPMEDDAYCGEAVHLKGAHFCRIASNHFAAVGGNAVFLEGYNLKNVIQGNEIDFAGHCGIVLLGRRDDPNGLHLPMCNDVTDNRIHHCGVFDKAAVGVFCGVSSGNVIGHNLIEQVPHHAINLGNSGYGRNIVEYNRICHACQETGDNAAINCWMEDEHVERDAVRAGHVFRYNYISDTPGACTFGIYLDNHSSNCLVYGNIIVRTGLSGIRINGGRNNIVENNIIVGNAEWISFWNPANGLWPQMKGFMSANQFGHNIVYRPGSGTKPLINIDERSEYVSQVIGRSDDNVFFDTTGRQFNIAVSGAKDVPFAEWRKMGYETHSAVADPLFIDPQRDDYRLRPESPALKLGFRPIEVDKIGPRGKGAGTPCQKAADSQNGPMPSGTRHSNG